MVREIRARQRFAAAIIMCQGGSRPLIDARARRRSA